MFTSCRWLPFVAAGILLPGLASAQWVRQRAPGNLFSLTDIHFTDASHGFASAAIGGFMKTSDGGATWTDMPTGVTSSLRDVYFVNPDTGYVVGNVGVIIGTTDGGQSWTHYDLPNTGQSVNGVYFHNRLTGMVTQGDAILRTTNGGVTWDTAYQYNGSLQIFTFRFLEFADQSTGYAVGGYSGSFGNVAEVAKTTDGGRTWALVPSVAGTVPMGGAAAVAFPDAQTGYVADVQDRIFRTTDGGLTWTIVAQRNFGSFYGMHFTDAMTGYGVGFGGNLRRTTNGGANWQDQSLNNQDTYSAVYFPTPQVGYAAGDINGMAGVLQYTDPMAMPEPLVAGGIELAPNPARDVVRLSNLPTSSPVRLTLLDLAGRTVRQAMLTGSSTGQLHTTGLPAGLYLLQLETDGRTCQQKLVVD